MNDVESILEKGKEIRSPESDFSPSLAGKIKEIDYKNSSALLISANISFLKGFLEKSIIVDPFEVVI